MEYCESSGWYVNDEELKITYYEAWYQLSVREDDSIRYFLVPGSLEEETIPLTAFYQMLFVYLSAQSSVKRISQAALAVPA